jgi:hypothetical protein
MFDDWWNLFAAALGGGATAKILEVIYGEARDWFRQRSSSARIISTSLEPLLKSSDELVAKLRSLSEQDFLPIRAADPSDLQDTDFSGVVFLFVQFWSWIEIFRLQSFDNEMGRSKTGRRLTAFFDCLESRRVRLVDRISQRAVGEAAIARNRPANFVEFVRLYESDEYLRRWLKPLVAVLANLNKVEQRQRVLQYYVVLHAMIDTLDQKHLITRNRPATPNKLSKNSWRDLEYRVFGVYLKFVKHRSKYIGPPKRRP